MSRADTKNRVDHLAGCRILLVEDEWMIADELARGLSDAGAVVLGPLPSVDAALTEVEAREDLHVAVMDINLSGTRSYEVIDRLMQRGVAVILATGYNSDDLPPAYGRLPILEKPVRVDDLLRLIEAVRQPGQSAH